MKSPDIFNLVKPLIAKSELETAHRIRSEISAAFSYAIAHGLTDYDPAQAVAKQLPAQKVKHRPALIEPSQVAQLLRDITHYQGTFVVQCALRLSPLLFQRPGEIRQMEWNGKILIRQRVNGDTLSLKQNLIISCHSVRKRLKFSKASSR